MRDLNTLYRGIPALSELDHEPGGFEWVDCDDAGSSVVSFLRFSADRSDIVLVVCNFTPVPRSAYRVGVPAAGEWREILNSDAEMYGGSGMGNYGGGWASAEPSHGRPWSLTLTLPPLGVIAFRWKG